MRSHFTAGCISGATALLWLYKVSSRPGAVIREASSLPGGHTAAVRAAFQSNTGLPVDNNVVFVDCPAYRDKRGTVRCGLPAEVEDRYTMTSTDGPLESARIRCPRGHFFNGPIEAFYWESQSAGQPSARSVSPGRATSRETNGH